MIDTDRYNITASDLTGQRRVAARQILRDTTIGELVDGLKPQMKLAEDRHGKPIQVQARLEREGRHLHRSELVGEALRDDDHLILHPRVMAG